MSEHNDSVIYKEIPGFNGCYRAGDDGSVWTCKVPIAYRTWGAGPVWRLLSPMDKSGYLWVALSNNGKVFNRSVASIILETFVGPRPDGYDACHFPDHTTSNNSLANLRWGSKADNMDDKNKLGHQRRDASHPNTKLTKEQVIQIREAVASGERQRDVAARFCISPISINLAVTGRTWKNAGGPVHEVKQHTILSSHQAAAIRSRRLAGEKLADLAREFCVSQTTICAVAKGQARCGATKIDVELLADVPTDKSRGIPRGEQCNFSKLTEEKVVELRNRYANSESAVDLAKEFDLTLTGLRYIVVGKNWKHAGGVISVWRNLKNKVIQCQ